MDPKCNSSDVPVAQNAMDGAAAHAIRATVARGARFTGVCGLARIIGVSAAYLSQVLHGRPASPRVRDALARLGIAVQAREEETNGRGKATNGAEGG